MYRVLPVLILFSFIEIKMYSSDNDSINSKSNKHSRVYTTMRLPGAKPVIDGKLNDECWKLGEWAGNFTQLMPVEGAKPSQKTEFKIFYDDKNVYVAIRCFDNQMDKVIRKMGRRDDLAGDAAGINFDSYHDHRTGFEFNVTAAGQKTDILLTNPMNPDFNWNAVWYAKTGVEDSAWTAEYEIPLSQLRYSSNYEQTWGMHVWRWLDRNQEESDWEPQSFTSPGILYLFGELNGIKGLPKSRRIEIVPYSVGKLKTFEKQPGNPFSSDGRDWFGNAGIDAKIGLSSNFTLDLTINPDFGQVESDPSEMNLTAFETFFQEKRPFFLEGKNIFSFDFDDNTLFYSRRIGHFPSYSVDADTQKYPDNTTILGAFKLSGKNSKGLSIGMLESVTGKETAEYLSFGISKKIAVEPLSNYTILRVQQDINQSNTVIGGILTSANRFIASDNLKNLNRNAFTGGLDLLHQWHDKKYFIDAKLVGSDINGDRLALQNLQSSSARYFQRPDVDYVRYDSSLTNLSGFGGKFKIGKGTGQWKYSTELNWRSPGLELNDLGYMQMADVVKQENSISYFVTQPVAFLRTYNFGVTEYNKWDFGMNYLRSGVNFGFYLEFLNKWALNTNFEYASAGINNTILRGGGSIKVPYYWTGHFYVRTDPSKKVFLDLFSEYKFSGNNNVKYYALQPGIAIIPFNPLKLSVGLNYGNNIDRLQFITDSVSVGGVKKYIFGKINQDILSMVFRVDYNITPELSIQYYGSPFGSVGKYSEFKSITNPKADKYGDRYSLLSTFPGKDKYNIIENEIDYSIGIPDFNYYQFRSNLVFRWEYRPGSQLYLVWANEKTYYENPDFSSVSNIFKKLKTASPNNIFLIKFNYWFSL